MDAPKKPLPEPSNPEFPLQAAGLAVLPCVGELHGPNWAFAAGLMVVLPIAVYVIAKRSQARAMRKAAQERDQSGP